MGGTDVITDVESLINRHVTPDPDDPEGYRITVDRFPGWATMPDW